MEGMPDSRSVLRRLPRCRVQDEATVISSVPRVIVEVEHRRERARESIERAATDAAGTPVVLDEAQDRSLVCERVVDKVRPRERRDNNQRLARPVAAATLDRLPETVHERRAAPADPGAVELVAGAGARAHGGR